MKKVLLLLFFTLYFFYSFSQQVFPGGGSGSYTLTHPTGPFQLPNPAPPGISFYMYPGETWFRKNIAQPKVMPGYNKPVPANDWWTSAIFNYNTTDIDNCAPYSYTLWAHPLAYQATRYGLYLAYTANPTVAGTDYHYWQEPNMYVGLKGMDVPASTGTRMKSFSDWTVTLNWDDGAGRVLEGTIGHGLPYAYFTRSAGSTPTLRFQVPPTTFANYSNANVVARGVNILGQNYGIFLPAGSSFGANYNLNYDEAFTGSGGTNIVSRIAWDLSIPAGQNYFSVALLPDNSAATLQYFAEHAFAFVTDTKVGWSYDENTNKVTTTFTVQTTPQGTTTETRALMALYRHQWKNTNAAFTSYTYVSPRGTMKVMEGNSFNTVITNNGLLPDMPDAGNYSRATLYTLVDNEFKKTYTTHFPNNQAGYYGGKFLQRVANLAEIAHQVKHYTARDTLLAYTKRYMQYWLSAPPGKSDQIFFYSPTWNSLTPYPQAYDSDRQLNDHHFGYGYFVKAAATIARFEKNKTWVSQWGPMIEMLIRDVAAWDRNDPLFPFLRNFDPYAGHSWASGHGNFFLKGNNQESTSEALNFASGTMLWGLNTGNATIRDLGMYLYTTEQYAARQYWFDEDNAVFPPSYAHNFASIVWGWGGEYQTWFAGDPEHTQGIQYLPMTGGSLYLGYNPTAAAANYATLVSKNGANETTDFRDAIWEFQALSNPSAAKAKFAAAGSYTNGESGETRAHVYHWICNLDSMGTVDSSVTANMASFAVFKKGSCKHYVVYNPPAPFSKPCVIYSDGNSFPLPKEDSIYVFKVCAVPPVFPKDTICKGQYKREVARDTLQSNYQWDLNGTNIAGATSWFYKATQTGTYHVTYTYGCATKKDSFYVYAKDTLSYSSPIYFCNNAGNYNITITITGGSNDPANYVVKGLGASSGLTFLRNGNTFTSSYMLPGAFKIEISDKVNTCDRDTISGTYSCSCLTNAGTMNTTKISVCDTATAKAIFNGGHVLDTNDTLLYFLHTYNNNDLGKVYGISNKPEFKYVNGLSYGTTYYISSVAGNKNGLGGIDTTESCLSVAPGTPVVFYKKPVVNLGNDTVLCSGSTFKLNANTPGTYLWSTGAVSNTIAVSSPGDYFVRVTDANGCTNSDTINVSLIGAPLITNISESCNNLATGYTVSFDITGGDATSYSVSVSGGGAGGPGTLSGSTFTSTLIPSGQSWSFVVTDQYGCTPNIRNGQKSCNCLTYSGTMSQTPLKVCGTSSATATHNGNEVLDPNDIILYYLHDNNGTSLGTVYQTSSTPSFTYDPSLTYGKTYYISAVAGNDNGSGGIDLSDPCVSISPGTPVVFYPVPTATVSGTNTICSDGSTTPVKVDLTGIGPFMLTITNGTQNLSVGGVNLNSYSYATNAPGTYSVTTVSDANCSSSGSGSAVITVNAVPTITVNGSSSICAGSSAALSATGADSYTWSPSAGLNVTSGSSVVASPAATTTYIVTGTSNGCTSTKQFVLTVKQVPSVSISGDTSICKGDATSLTAASDPGATFSWTPATGLDNTNTAFVSAQPSATTTYTLTVDLNGCPATKDVIITVDDLPVLNVSNPLPICKGQTAALTVSGASEYVWSPSTGLDITTGPTVNAGPQQTTTYTITGSTNGCSSMAQIILTVNPVPSISISGNTSFCFGNNTTLTASGASSYTWSPAAGLSSTNTSTVTASPTQNTTYTVEGTDANGCLAAQNVTVNVNPLPVISITGNTSMCSGESVELMASGALNYLWSPATGLDNTTSSSVVASPSGTTTYTVTGTDAVGCSSTQTHTLTINPVPVVTINASAAGVCSGGSVQLTASGADTYVWSPVTGLSSTTASSVTATPSSGTIYTVNGFSNGCSSFQTAVVEIYPIPEMSISGGKEICPGQTIDLKIDILSGKAPYAITYTDGKTVLNANSNTSSFVFAASKAGTYVVSGVKDANGCDANPGTSITTTITNPEPLSPKINPVGTLCAESSSTSLSSSPGGGVWLGGTFVMDDKKGIISPQKAGVGIHKVYYEVKNSCESFQDSIEIKVSKAPVIATFGKDSTICDGDTVRLGYNDLSLKYIWQDNSTAPSFIVTRAGTYHVKVSNSDNCTAYDTIRFSFDCPISIYIPNSFTPNGDDKNEIFRVEGENIIDFNMRIFNRWGECIYTSDNILKGWDGRVNGRDAQEEIYVYLINYSAFRDGTKVKRSSTIKGHVSLVR